MDDGGVALIGGAGRLGRFVVDELLPQRTVRIVDRELPASSPEQVDLVACDLRDEGRLRQALEGIDTVVHLAALHGAHLVAGASRNDCWTVNVDGTCTLVRAAQAAGVRRFVLASSVSVFGPGSTSGPARLLREDVPNAPDDIYDLTKLIAERIVSRTCRDAGMSTAILRFGRFFYGGHADYHLRKLASGVDVRDAAAAVALAINAATDAGLFCIASDLPLSDEQRHRLGQDAPAVLAEALGDLAAEFTLAGWPVPPRVGKSVDSSHAQLVLGYQPQRDLRWCAQRLRDERTAEPNVHDAHPALVPA